MPNVSPPAAEETSATAAPAIIAGFSARALAEAVTAGGFQPIVIDHFTDHDCRELAAAWYQIVHWGDCCAPLTCFLEELAASLPAVSARWVLLGGGTENWPELLAALRRNFQVLGPNTEQLAMLRDYRFWREAVVGSGVCFPVSHPLPPQSSPTLPLDRLCSDPPASDWLWKPARGAGGVSIRSLVSTNELAASCSSLKPGIYQQRIQGRSLGAHCVLATDEVRLLGLTESWTAADWPGPSEFIYRGSWGPVPIAESASQKILSLCRNIQRATGYVGWLQIDFIQDASEQLWLLELNPRWAAGMEILLLAGINPVVYHLAAWQAGVEAPLPTTTAQYGKAIVYAERPLQLSADNLTRLHALSRSNFVDLPSLDLAGVIVTAGQPLLTVRTACDLGNDEQTKRKRLLAKLRRLRAVAVEIIGGTDGGKD